jgi:hypothetical protein
MALRVDFYQEMVLLESSFDIDKELLENNQDAFEILLEYSSLNELEILFKKIYDSDSLYKQ